MSTFIIPAEPPSGDAGAAPASSSGDVSFIIPAPTSSAASDDPLFTGTTTILPGSTASNSTIPPGQREMVMIMEDGQGSIGETDVGGTGGGGGERGGDAAVVFLHGIEEIPATSTGGPEGSTTLPLEMGEKQTERDGALTIGNGSSTIDPMLPVEGVEGLIPLCVQHSKGPHQTTATFGYDIAQMKHRPWANKGAKRSDYFNYGFNEQSWRLYCALQKEGKESLVQRAREVWHALQVGASLSAPSPSLPSHLRTGDSTGGSGGGKVPPPPPPPFSTFGPHLEGGRGSRGGTSGPHSPGGMFYSPPPHGGGPTSAEGSHVYPYSAPPPGVHSPLPPPSSSSLTPHSHGLPRKTGSSTTTSGGGEYSGDNGNGAPSTMPPLPLSRDGDEGMRMGGGEGDSGSTNNRMMHTTAPPGHPQQQQHPMMRMRMDGNCAGVENGMNGGDRYYGMESGEGGDEEGGRGRGHRYSPMHTSGSANYTSHGSSSSGSMNGMPGGAPSNRRYKTQTCKDYMEGRCHRGAACNYAHGEEELRSLPPGFSPTPSSSSNMGMGGGGGSSGSVRLPKRPRQDYGDSSRPRR